MADSYATINLLVVANEVIPATGTTTIPFRLDTRPR